MVDTVRQKQQKHLRKQLRKQQQKQQKQKQQKQQKQLRKEKWQPDEQGVVVNAASAGCDDRGCDRCALCCGPGELTTCGACGTSLCYECSVMNDDDFDTNDYCPGHEFDGPVLVFKIVGTANLQTMTATKYV